MYIIIAIKNLRYSGTHAINAKNDRLFLPIETEPKRVSTSYGSLETVMFQVAVMSYILCLWSYSP